ncbi:MAG: hypothetical protein A2X86_18655 [Bdellovibrionales bacterium GWA2_49_15]|nr:MAG: hypothetical protein A2X86_18655 [Bdellovibrionales bacterium GWA2_49_15]HAZ14248.1 hypothetical protein [Bdellovibrionales bacterium]
MRQFWITRLLRQASGQGVMEYIIISGLIGIFCLGMVKQFGSVLQTRLEHMKATIAKEIK